MERVFGVLQSIFSILRRKEYRWFKGDIIDSSKVCVTSHNMLIRINENGCFAEDVSEDEGLLNVIEELNLEEVELAAFRAEELRERESWK